MDHPLFSALRRLIPVVAVAAACSVAAGSSPLAIAVRARSLSPGEPVRIEVSSSEPLESMEGEFLGSPVYMGRLSRLADGTERWSGWSMIGLDQAPGPAAVEVRASVADGGLRTATHAVTLRAKSFPVEQLAVAPRYVEPPEEVRERLDRERKTLDAIYRSPSPAGSELALFVRPVPGAPTSTFGTRRVFNGKPRSPHPGLDLRAAEGTSVSVSGPGHVALAQELYYSGNTVLVDHGGGLFTIYAHLSEILVEPGDPVEAGQVIGRSGATGRVTGPHLHWGAKIGSRPFDPTALLDPALF